MDDVILISMKLNLKIFFNSLLMKKPCKTERKKFSFTSFLIQGCIVFYTIVFFSPAFADKCEDIFLEKQKDLTAPVGIEFEGLIPQGISKQEIAKVLIKYFEDLNTSNRFSVNISGEILFKEEEMIFPSLITDNVVKKNNSLFIITYEKDGYPYKWEVKSDISIKDSEDRYGIEIASPILRNTEDRQMFYSALHHLENRYGLKSEPQTGAIHIHVSYGNEDTAFNSLNTFQLLKIFSIVKESLYKYFQVSSPRQSSYSRPFSSEGPDLLPGLSLREIPIEEKYVDVIKNRKGPFYVNREYKTVEFRLFNSTTDSEEIEFQVRFSNRLIDAIQNQESELMDFIDRHSSFSSADARDLFDILQIR